MARSVLQESRIQNQSAVTINCMKIPRLLCSACLLAAAAPLSAAPANDNFSAPAAITAASGTLPAVNTSTATIESGEPEHAQVSGGHSIWHRFTPAAKDHFVF